MIGAACVGHVFREHGVRGYCKVVIKDEFLNSWAVNLKVNLESKSGRHLVCRLMDTKPMGKFQLAHFETFDHPEQIREFRGASIFIETSDLKRKAGQIFDHEWIGSTLSTLAGQEVGEIVSVTYTPLPQFEVMNKQGQKFLIPLVHDWISEHRIKEKILIMDIPDGLF